MADINNLKRWFALAILLVFFQSPGHPFNCCLAIFIGVLYVYFIYFSKDYESATQMHIATDDGKVKPRGFPSTRKCQTMTKNDKKRTSLLSNKMLSLFSLDPLVIQEVDIKRFNSIQKRERKILLETLQEIHDTENYIYTHHTAYRNVHCFLLLSQYQDPGNDDEDEDYLDKCIEMNEKVLQIDSMNVIALDIKINILKEQNSSSSAIGNLQSKIDNCSQKQLAKAHFEIAFYLSRLDYRFYPIATELMENSLKDMSENDSFCNYELAYIYNKMLNKDFARLCNSSYCVQDIYNRIRQLLSPIIHSDHILKYRSMVDLADAYKKVRYLNMDLLNGYTPDSLYSYSCRHSQNDPHVLERYGRHLRYKAIEGRYDETLLHESKHMLSNVVSRCLRRHVAWHQLGLTYKALWLAVNKIQWDERKDKNKKKRSKKNNSKGSLNSNNAPLDITRLKAYNPLCKNTLHVEYLIEAKKCLNNANRYCRSSVYLVDLARVAVSLEDRSLAKQCLSKACKQRVRSSQTEEVIFYEQLALFRLQEILPKLQEYDTESNVIINNIKDLLFKAIECAELSRWKPVDSYNILLYLLKHCSPESDDIYQELSIVEMFMGYYKNAERFIDNSSKNKSSLLHRVNLYQKQNKFSDAYFLLVEMICNKMVDIKESTAQLIELACCAARTRDNSVGENTIYHDVFILLHENLLNNTNVSSNTTRRVDLRYDIMLLIEERQCAIVNLFEKMFEMFGFSVFIVSSDNCDDLLPGSNVISTPQQKICQSDLVLAYYHNNEMLSYHIDNMIASNMINKLILIDNGQNNPQQWDAVEKICIPRLSNEGFSNEKEMYHCLMKEVFNCVKSLCNIG